VALASQARKMPRREALGFASGILADAEIEVVWIGAELHSAGISLLQGQLIKAIPFVTQ
jgi:hypothetical protein